MICFYGKWKFVPNLLVVLTVYKPLFFQLSVEGFAVDKMAGEVKVRKIQFTFHFYFTFIFNPENKNTNQL